jgi:hypothetical protein
VGNFLVVIPVKGAGTGAKRLFHNGLEAAREIRGQAPNESLENEWSMAAAFTRQNGSGGKVVVDSETGNWLLASGTWFHNDGYSSGKETRLLRRFFEVGAERLAGELEGFFVLICGDARTREVVVITDIVGSCHCFQRPFDDAIVLSGSSLLLASLEEWHLDLVACQEFLFTGIIYEDRTCYQEVRKLEPATVFRFANGSKKTQERYWGAADVKVESLGGDLAVDALWERMRRAAGRIHVLYGNPVCDLTGGYDSRALVATFLGADVHCTTAVSGADDSADVRISRALARELGLPHIHHEPLQRISFEKVQACLALTDGEYDLVNYAQIREIHNKLASQFDISINGSFGEVARGYWWELLLPRIGARRPLPGRKVSQLRYAAHTYDASILPAEKRLDLVEHFTGVIERTNSGLTGCPNTFQMDHAYLMMRMHRWQGRIASSTNQMWPCLSPFMFRSVLETMLKTRAMSRWRSLLIRKMLARYSPTMAAYPLEHGLPAEPTTWRNFYRFFPLAKYFGEKVTGKIGLRRKTRAKLDGADSRLQLWSHEPVQELLRPSSMKLTGTMDPSALSGFLDRSKQNSFDFAEQWARVLSLECALRVADRARLNFER